MKHHLIIPAVAVLLFPALCDAQSLTAEYCGIQIVTQSYGKENAEIRPFQAFDDGVKIAFMLKSATGGIIAVDEDQGKIEAFTDDKGTSLMKKGEFKNGFSSFSSVSEDGKAAVFTLEGTVTPPPALQKVSAKGTIAVKVATKKETVKGGAVKAGAAITCGTQKLTVKEFSTENGETSVTLESKEAFDSIVEVKWLDASGKPLEAESGGGGSFGFNGNVTYSKTMSVKGTPATVEFVKWTDMKTVQVPFSATVSSGMVK